MKLKFKSLKYSPFTVNYSVVKYVGFGTDGESLYASVCFPAVCCAHVTFNV